MSLKTDYTDGANGFGQKMAAAAATGSQWVTDNSATITNKLQENAGKGLKKFTVQIAVTFEPNNLRLKGLHWESFRSGLLGQLIAEDIYEYECDPQINLSDNVVTNIDLVFDFTGQLS